MSATVHALAYTPGKESHSKRRSDWWLVAFVAAIAVMLIAGVVRRVDPQTLSEQEAPLLVAD
jgi:hypothetical protein